MNTDSTKHLKEETQVLIEQGIELIDNAAILKKLYESITLADVKNEIALERGYTSWDYLIAVNPYNEKLRDEVSERYAESKLLAYQARRN